MVRGLAVDEGPGLLRDDDPAEQPAPPARRVAVPGLGRTTAPSPSACAQAWPSGPRRSSSRRRCRPSAGSSSSGPGCCAPGRRSSAACWALSAVVWNVGHDWRSLRSGTAPGTTWLDRMIDWTDRVTVITGMATPWDSERVLVPHVVALVVVAALVAAAGWHTRRIACRACSRSSSSASGSSRPSTAWPAHRGRTSATSIRCSLALALCLGLALGPVGRPAIPPLVRLVVFAVVGGGGQRVGWWACRPRATGPNPTGSSPRRPSTSSSRCWTIADVDFDEHVVFAAMRSATRSRCRAPRSGSGSSPCRNRRAAALLERLQMATDLRGQEARHVAAEVVGMRGDVAKAAGRAAPLGSVRQAACFWSLVFEPRAEPALDVEGPDGVDLAEFAGRRSSRGPAAPADSRCSCA